VLNDSDLLKLLVIYRVGVELELFHSQSKPVWPQKSLPLEAEAALALAPLALLSASSAVANASWERMNAFTATTPPNGHAAQSAAQSIVSAPNSWRATFSPLNCRLPPSSKCCNRSTTSPAGAQLSAHPAGIDVEVISACSAIFNPCLKGNDMFLIVFLQAIAF
jgi:hypothetical protein